MKSNRFKSEILILQIVEHRDEPTLLPLIAQHLRPNTIVVTDQRRAYQKLINIPGRQFQHLSVNHSLHYVDPIDQRVHTQTVEVVTF